MASGARPTRLLVEAIARRRRWRRTTSNACESDGLSYSVSSSVYSESAILELVKRKRTLTAARQNHRPYRSLASHAEIYDFNFARRQFGRILNNSSYVVGL